MAEAAQDISIDHAVMEKAENISVVPFNGSWSDLGSWRSVWEESELTATGVSATEECYPSRLP